MQRRAQIVGLYKPGPTMGQIITRDAQRNREAAKSLRQASYAAARLVAAPRGVPMYAVGHGQMGRGEVKFFDCALTVPSTAGPYGFQTIAAPPTGVEPATAFTGITEINCVPQGATSYNRIGTKILMKSIMFNSTIFLGGSGPTQGVYRYMIVYDHQPNGAFPAVADLISQNIGPAPTMYSGVNMSNRSRFIVLRDRVGSLDVDGGNGAMVHVKEFIKCKLETQFKTNTGTIGDITTGAVYFIAFASLSSAVTYVTMSAPTFRIRYFD